MSPGTQQQLLQAKTRDVKMRPVCKGSNTTGDKVAKQAIMLA